MDVGGRYHLKLELPLHKSNPTSCQIVKVKSSLHIKQEVLCEEVEEVLQVNVTEQVVVLHSKSNVETISTVYLKSPHFCDDYKIYN